MLFLYFILFFRIDIIFSKVNDPNLILTKDGYVRGSSDSFASLYLGIPFAQAPVNTLRWREPLDVEPWSPNILNATKFKPACPQLNCTTRMPSLVCPTELSEDCLYLNVFVPKTNESNKPVMLFIHGGNFQYTGASSRLHDGRYFANNSDVIVVTISYRLGALGWLVTGNGDDDVKGNLGLLDQRMAIKWVKDNIESFGGDPNRITLFGQSAGAQSATVHLLSSDMQSMFNNAIIQSAPMTIPFRSYTEALLICDYFLKELNCAIGDRACIMGKSFTEILEAQMAVETKVSSIRLLEFFEPWLPWVDNQLVKGQLLEIEKWTGSNMPIKPFMIDTLTEESFIFIYLAFQKPFDAKQYAEILLGAFKQHAPAVLINYPPQFNPNDQRGIMATMATNWIFSCSSRNFIEKVIAYNKSQASYYQAVFDFPLDFAGWDKGQAFCDGHVCHGADLPYTFGTTGPYNFTTIGQQITNSHMFYWGNFASNSNPNQANSPLFDTWPAYDLNTKTFLRFASPKNRIENSYLKSECDFFDKIGYYY